MTAPDSTPALALARHGEQLAARHLRGLGMDVLEMNWRCPQGEVDLVAREGEVLVICEVKTRRGSRYGPPLEAITHDKARRLRQLAAAYLREGTQRCSQVRVDAIGITWPDGLAPTLLHVRGVA